ncbi:speckle-type POZ protein B-like [Belonocnema kinseyi]|uniref:speckle-type POZ protein B-like n=1 Tax=Belonocnema kinseyi TaxID=2817044 RepID=UPI00143D8DAD|nr:speckle-type POZ protein B-like [Belonocnema kinseyi]XP_033214370.1 speckle-type POZ protein B-like [Belonocnema kinseyi]
MSDASIPRLKMTDTSEDLHCSTKLNYRTIGIRWTIENYDDVCKTVKLLKSPEFPEGEEELQKWCIEFEPLEIIPNSQQLLVVYLKRRPLNGDIYVDAILGLEDKSKHVLNLSFKCIVPDGEYGVFRFLVKNICETLLWNETADKSLTITCKIRIFDTSEPKTETASRKNISEFFETSDLIQDISKLLLNDQAFQDVTISVGEKTFRAHKAILATRSEVFQAMFTNEMSEKSNSLVEIEDLTPKVIEKMLLFIYTDKVEDSDLKEFAPQLLDAAEKYNLRRLKEMCIAALYENLSIENVLNTLEIADTYSIPNLKKEALQFLVAHRQVVICQDEFKTLIAERPHLVVEMFRMNIQNNNPETSTDTLFKRMRDIIAEK